MTNNYFAITLVEILVLYYQRRTILNQWSAPSKRRFKALIKHLLAFNQNINAQHCDSHFLSHFVNFLTTRRKMADGAIKTYVGLIKSALEWSCRFGYHTQTDFRKFKYHSVYPKSNDFLTIDEINLLLNFRFPPVYKHLIEVARTFVLMCLTGLTLEILLTLKRSDIYDEKFVGYTQSNTIVIVDFQNVNGNLKEFIYRDKDESLIPISLAYLPDFYNKLREMGKVVGLTRMVNRVTKKGNKVLTVTQPLYEILGIRVARKTYKEHNFGNYYCETKKDNFFFTKTITLKNL